MASNLIIAGNTYPSVPSILVPKAESGVASFFDISDTTCVAGDVAQGKYFYTAQGVRTAGTSSGGGGSWLAGVLRPDAVKVQTYTYDQLLHEDEGKTIPSYTSTSTTVLSGVNLTPTVSVDSANYDYFVLERIFAYPVYNTATAVQGRCEYVVGTYFAELVNIPANSFITKSGKKYTSSVTAVNATTLQGRLLYWSSTSQVRVYASSAYGTGFSITAPALSGTTLTIKSPTFLVRGSSSYFSSSAWSSMTDIRAQYVIDVYKAPKGNTLHECGYNILSSIGASLDAINNSSTWTLS